jgi:hypothetical protein
MTGIAHSTSRRHFRRRHRWRRRRRSAFWLRAKVGFSFRRMTCSALLTTCDLRRLDLVSSARVVAAIKYSGGYYNSFLRGPHSTREQRPIPGPEPPRPQLQEETDDHQRQEAAPQFPPGVKIEQGAGAAPSPAASQTIGGHRQPNGHGATPPVSAPLPPSAFAPGVADLVLPYERAKQRGRLYGIVYESELTGVV